MVWKPTDEQSAVVEAIKRDSRSLMIEAGAGCAKTSTLKMASRGVREASLALAFNKRIADDLRGALPDNFLVKTLNGMGHSAWGRRTPGNLKLDDRKLGKLVSQVAKDRGVPLDSDQWDSLRQLVSAAMQSGLVPRAYADRVDAEGGWPEDLRESWRDIGDSIGLFSDDFDLLWELAREVLEKNIALALEGVISFDDQIYCSVLLGGRFPSFGVVFIDEYQDLSPLNIAMLGRCLRHDGRIVAVGDKRQAIYAWRGAAGDSAERIRRLRDSGEAWKDLPLMTTFRCPRVVVERQRAHVPGFRAWEGASLGKFVHWEVNEATPLGAWDWNKVTELRGGIPSLQRASLAILCRNNAPLLSMAFKLIRRSVGVQVLGREIGKGLVALVKKLDKGEPMSLEALLASLGEWQTTEESLALANGKPEKVAGIIDRAECIRAVAYGANARDSNDVRSQIEKLFEEKGAQVVLSSIHKAKGLEWDMVIHLDPWRIPSRQAKLALKLGNRVPWEQEMNLRYVCETRTRHTLALGNLEDFS